MFTFFCFWRERDEEEEEEEERKDVRLLS
jgi:hypothetical protein